jgi:two-component system, chemotaxis family, protein-glutamate methylesterase/glutaminase
MTRGKPKMIRVLVVEDSPVARDLLVFILGSDPDIKVVATAGDGVQAIDMALKERPDVITMDVHMPRLDGIEAVRTIMATYPIPTVIISASIDPGEVGDAFRALEAGAIAVCEKPRGITHPLYQAQARKIVQTVKMVSEIRVVRRWKPSSEARYRPAQNPSREVQGEPRVELVVIGASTGGPPVLCDILSGLTGGFPAPIMIVQHIAPGFLPGLVGLLAAASAVPVEIASDAKILQPGHAYIAPDGVHMEVQRTRTVHLAHHAPVNGMCPSVSVLFRSVAEAFDRSAAGVLLTGMGRDGADELLLMKNKGALTIAQDKESSVIHGMPGEAIKLGAARHVLSPDKIVDLLNSCTGRKQE